MRRNIRKPWLAVVLGLVLPILLATPVGATAGELMDLEEQLDALGKEELMEQVPDEARELLDEAGLDDLSAAKLLQLAPKDFFRTLWQLFLREAKKPLRTLGIVGAVTVLCVLMKSLGETVSDSSLSQVFSLISALCILTSVITPILDCIVETSAAIRNASLFMLSFIPMFSASLIASGRPVTGSAYNLFLFSTCQAVSQVISQTLIPLMGIYLAICIVGALVPEIKISAATQGIKSVVTWVLAFVVTVFVGLLTLQTLVSKSADSVSQRTAQFLVGSFVPVVGGALSEAMSAARGCLQLLKTSVGGYGMAVAAFTLLPILIRTALWCGVTGAAGMAGEILGVDKMAQIMKGCSSVLSILISILLSFALLVIVSTAIVLMASGAVN